MVLRDTEGCIDGANELQRGATSRATRSGSDIIFRELLILDALLPARSTMNERMRGGEAGRWPMQKGRMVHLRSDSVIRPAAKNNDASSIQSVISSPQELAAGHYHNS